MKKFFWKLFFTSVTIAIILGITQPFIISSPFYDIINYIKIAMYGFILTAALSLILAVVLSIFSKE